MTRSHTSHHTLYKHTDLKDVVSAVEDQGVGLRFVLAVQGVEAKALALGRMRRFF